MKYLILIIIFSVSLFSKEIDFESYWNNYYKYSFSIQKHCNFYGLDTNIFKGIICRENQKWNATAKGIGGFGLCQVSGGSANSDINIKQACIKLRQALDFYGNYYDALIGYNCGIQGAKSIIKSGKLWLYSQDIMRFANILKTLDHEVIALWRKTWNGNDYQYYGEN
jgi:hypothetical protein